MNNPSDLARRSDFTQGASAGVPVSIAALPFALLVPSHDRMGTNALLLAPPDIIKLRFGYDSFTYHMSQVSARGLPVRFIENERIGLDIDEPKDLQHFLSFGREEGESARTARAMLVAQVPETSRNCGEL